MGLSLALAFFSCLSSLFLFLQMLAAVAYARNPDGIWFFNPSQWVDHHLFKDQSIWSIPLVKPRFSCLLDMSLAVRGNDMGLALRKTLGFFRGAGRSLTAFRETDFKSPTSY